MWTLHSLCWWRVRGSIVVKWGLQAGMRNDILCGYVIRVHVSGYILATKTLREVIKDAWCWIIEARRVGGMCNQGECRVCMLDAKECSCFKGVARWGPTVDCLQVDGKLWWRVSLVIGMVQTNRSMFMSKMAGHPMIEFTATFSPRLNEIVMGGCAGLDTG